MLGTISPCGTHEGPQTGYAPIFLIRAPQ
ncbi:uncharacterized protein METZ01_LOCUS258839, partial [marine metagenome]